jgi:pre-rRNA-processing protein TSR3
MYKKIETIIVRHRKERLSKCSLRGLESRPDCCFFSYPYKQVPVVDGAVLLSLDAPRLSIADAKHRLLLLDATWRYAERMLRDLSSCNGLIPRSLPAGAQTAYPRRQDDCPDASAGLASVEALYLSYVITGRCTEGLLDHYYWKEQFLNLNRDYIEHYDRLAREAKDCTC